jgi:hypothetical protein
MFAAFQRPFHHLGFAIFLGLHVFNMSLDIGLEFVIRHGAELAV